MCPNLLVTMWYPNDKATEAGQAFLKVSAAPPKFSKRIADSPYSAPTEEGIKVISLYEIEPTKWADAITEIAQRNTQVAGMIPGCRWQAEIVLSVKEALPLIGLKPPTK